MYSGTQLYKEFQKVLDTLFNTEEYGYANGYGYAFMENWMKYKNLIGE